DAVTTMASLGASTRLAGVAVVSGAGNAFGAFAFDGDRMVGEIADPAALRVAVQGQAVISDRVGPAKATMLQAAAFPLPEVWDVLELAGLVLPRWPRERLEHLGGHLGLQ